jgi:hypothetical protein
MGRENSIIANYFQVRDYQTVEGPCLLRAFSLVEEMVKITPVKCLVIISPLLCIVSPASILAFSLA